MQTDRFLREAHPSAVRRGSFTGRLAVAFAAVAAFTAILAAVLSTAAWDYQFNRYVKANLQQVADQVAEGARRAYIYYGGWTLQARNAIPNVAGSSAVAVQVRDDSGYVIYDSSMRAPSTTGEAASVRQKILQAQNTMVSSPVVVAGIPVGTVRMWATGAGLMSERDRQFRTGSVAALALTALVAIIAASFAGTAYARRLVAPIARITATAQAIRGGDHDARSGIVGDDEISVLGMTLDDMADSIEADREMERRLTADVAHELRTPLQAIQATVEAMQDGVLPADEERLGTVRDETIRLARLADGILELTRLERGSIPMRTERVDLGDPVRRAVDAVEALLESRGLALSVDIGPGIFVVGDTDRLQQAVVNLLSNAARYTSPGGRVEVRVSAEAGQAIISVSDTGMGMRTEELQNVFSRFWRADSARATTTGGLGIGLAVTKEIVDRHRGTIGVESAWGEGTRFTIRLPLS